MKDLQDPNSEYILPFDPLEARVSRIIGFGESESHQGRFRNAIDFCMPEGERIIAARSGTIRAVVLGYRGGGLDPELKGVQNYIQILHDDGTIAEYSHLEHCSTPFISEEFMLIEEGERINQGAHIGYSGNSGYTSEPHLHFCVTRDLFRDLRKSKLRFLGIFGRRYLPSFWFASPVKFRNWDKLDNP